MGTSRPDSRPPIETTLTHFMMGRGERLSVEHL